MWFPGKNIRHALACLPALCALGAAPPLHAQLAHVSAADTLGERPQPQRGLVTREEIMVDRLRRLGIDNPDPYPKRPTSRADSVRWERGRAEAWGARGRRIIISVYDRMLWYVDGERTLVTSPAGVGMGLARTTTGRTIDFSTPIGRRTVLAKERDPLWTPPDWHYYSQPAKRVRRFPEGGVALADGGRLVRRGDRMGIVRGGEFEALPPERPLEFDSTLYIPPFGTRNRQIPFVLGKYKLDTGDGILIHGTNEPISVGFPATHGCIRLGPVALEKLYRHATVGTQVYIY
ncbi:MAG TPA: L,D-transpeptidase [Longimicrobiaceae bacterium]|nr:L,D-transpeptidase [Longimicrobiaceae bacterium]